ncbi:unnamed protein product [Schistosoma mattheei]|uniref:Uncharacterized protein n=1 Tax=Schistosoma mattheei TaxID=31246 RepID=A0A183PIH0_9TREM|nr:unnamed protein product [Schistosoma mattheei]
MKFSDLKSLNEFPSLKRLIASVESVPSNFLHLNFKIPNCLTKIESTILFFPTPCFILDIGTQTRPGPIDHDTGPS